VSTRPSPEPDLPGPPSLRWLAWTLGMTSVAFWVVTAVFYKSLESALLSGFVVVGVVVATKRTRNPVGWLLLVAGWLFSLSLLLSAYGQAAAEGNADSVLGSWAEWGSRLTGGALLAFMVVVFLPLLFPEGRLLSPHWRPVVWLALVTLGLSLASELFDPTTWEDSEHLYPLPLALPSWATEVLAIINPVLLVLTLVAVVASIVIRFRRSKGLQRQQFKWVALPAMSLIVFAVFVVIDRLGSDPFGEPSETLLGAVVALAWLLGVIGLPVGVGLAVLRYRLYDIDRILSRTVTYILVVGLLAAMFASVAIGLPQLLGLTEGSPMLVAAATLAVAALFNPLRRRIQARVDRRFNRARYDAQQEIDRLTQRLRTDMEIVDIADELLGVVTKTMQPASAGVWIREER
jgi:hypothetical protein